MERGFYPAVFARRGMTVVVPDADDRTYVNDRYFGELVEGSFREETSAGMSAIVGRMKDRQGIDAVILGGRELPLLFRDRPPSVVPILDTTTIHVQAADRADVRRRLTGSTSALRRGSRSGAARSEARLG